MNRLLTLLFCLLGIASIAQFSVEESYQGVFAKKDPQGPDRMNRWFIDGVHEGWYEYPANLKPEWHSRGLYITRMGDIPFGKKGHVGLGIGVSFTFEAFFHNGQFTINRDSLSGKEYYSLQPLPANYNYKKNKTNFHWVDVPFELRFRTAGKNNFYFYPGFRAGWLLAGFTKRIDDTGKSKIYHNKQLNRLRYGPSLRVGYNRWGVFGFYDLSGMFAEGEGDVIRSYCVGISLTFF